LHRILQKTGMPAFLIAMGAMLALVVTALLLAVGYRDQVHELKAAVYHRCQQRATYDQTQQAVNRAVLAYYDDLIGNIRANAAHDEFYRRLTARVQLIRSELRRNLDHGAPVGCSQYR
jgi:hypothetical protein